MRELEQSYLLVFVSIFVTESAYMAKVKTSIKIHGLFGLFFFFFLSKNSAGINIIKENIPILRGKGFKKKSKTKKTLHPSYSIERLCEK